jgi:hypothetical protein
VNEGGSVIVDQHYIYSVDVDRSATGVADSPTLTVTALPSHGKLWLDSNGDGTFETEIKSANMATTPFTQAQVEAGRL